MGNPPSIASGERTKLLLAQVLINSGKFRPLTRISGQVTLLVALFEADNDKEPWESRIREGVKGRAGPETESRLRARAEMLGLLENRNTTEPCTDELELLARLYATAARLRSMGTEAGRVEAEAIEWAIRQTDGRS